MTSAPFDEWKTQIDEGIVDYEKDEGEHNTVDDDQ